MALLVDAKDSFKSATSIGPLDFSYFTICGRTRVVQHKTYAGTYESQSMGLCNKVRVK